MLYNHYKNVNMMEEKEFWKIIDRTLEHSPVIDTQVYDMFLIKQLEQKSVQNIVQFQLCLLKLRRELDLFEVNKAARKLGYDASRETFNRFCNGIIASGKSFHDKAKQEYGFLEKIIKKNPLQLRALYYEGFCLTAPAAFYQKKGLDADWDLALRNEKRMLELDRDKGQKSIDLKL